MAQRETTTTRDGSGEEEEALSLSDFPVAADFKASADGDEVDGADEAAEDFEFRTALGGGLLSDGKEADMCAADEVFFQGQLLPLRSSVSSNSGLFGASRSGSMDWTSGASVSSLDLDSSRSNSRGSSRSSSCVSRSQSSSSRSSGACEPPPQLSLANNFYSHPSPSPQVRRGKAASSRRSTSTAPTSGWGIFRLGVAKAPEIELWDMRSRRSSSAGTSGRKSNADVDRAVKKSASVKDEDSKIHDASRGRERKAAKMAGARVFDLVFSCSRCPPDVGEPLPTSKAPTATSKGEEESEDVGSSLRRGESMPRSRIFEWLEELTIAKATRS